MSQAQTQLQKLVKQDAYYIASGFFNDEQIADVDKIEESLKGLNIRHFSPRQESIAFFKEQNEEYKSMMTKLIFNNNLDCMNSCNKFIVNLRGEDQGTVFEYGYIAGQYDGLPNVAATLSASVKVMNDATGLEAKVLSATEGFGELKKFGKDYDYVQTLINSEKADYIKALYENNKLGIFCIDDRDPINIFLIGVYYRLRLPIITYSHKGYGTNVMLVHSTTHFDKVIEMEETLETMNTELYNLDGASVFNKSESNLSLETTNKVLSKLFLNKQRWDVNID